MKRLLLLWSLLLLTMPRGTLWAADNLPALPTSGASQAVLPLSHIVLYTSGVGYFQRHGQVHDSGEIFLRFNTEHINDLLKSMVVQDVDGGQVTAVSYDSRDPLARTLQSYAIDLTTNPGLGELLQQLRGEAIEIATSVLSRGIIVGVETKRERVGEQEVLEVEYVNVLTEQGLRTLPLAQIQRLTILDSRIDAELRQALALLASQHDTQKKTVRIRFAGQGTRRLRVAYIAPMPVWKTAYRLVLSDTAEPFLQGWAIVENVTDEDWHNVRLSLVSGRPISFVMDLYEPFYVERPVVVPEFYASLRPQTYEPALERQPSPTRTFKAQAERDEAAEKQAAPPRSQVFAGAPAAPPAAEALQLQQGVSAAAQAAELGELFEYAISTPVTLARQTSAMLPIINTAVRGSKLSIYNATVHAKYPLHGFRLHNTTALHLMQGPLTVFDGNSYAGDARLSDVPPGQEQLLSYGIDLQTEVESATTAESHDLLTVRLRRGTLLVTRKAITEHTYTIRNRGQKPTFLLIEHPVRAEWQLTLPEHPQERSRQVYRFAVTVAPDHTTPLRVREEKPLSESVHLTNAGPDLLAYYLQAPQVSRAVKQALQHVASLRQQLEHSREQQRQLAQRVQTLHQEQGRIRQNMERLAANSELYQRYVQKLDQQETELEALLRDSAALQRTEQQQQQGLEQYLLGLELE